MPTADSGAAPSPGATAGGVRRAKPRHWVEYLGFQLARSVAGALPERAASELGAWLGWLAGSVFRVRRRVVDDNLSRAFPDRSAAWRAQVARQSYRHLGRVAISTFRLSRLTPDRVVAFTEIEGVELLEEVASEGNGVVLLTGHFGNWEIGGAAVACRGFPLDVVVRPQNNPLFDRVLTQARERIGMNLVPRAHSTRTLLRSLRKGRMVGMLADQNARQAGVMVEFFGIPSSTARGPALLSLRTGAPMLLGVAFHDPTSKPPYRLFVERITAPRTGDLDDDIRELTAAHARALEQYVTSAPEQYLWQHRRWPPQQKPANLGEPPPTGAV